MDLAPIGIITYSRIDHLKKTIESLQENLLAKDSDIYIFIDGPKKEDKAKVDTVKEYVKTIQGFKKVYIKCRDVNGRLENYFNGVEFILKRYKKIIFLEDDNVVSATFLKYMNDGLNFYKDDKSVMAINGFNIPIEYPENSDNEYYKSSYFNAWGYATWEDRGILNIEKYGGQYDEIMSDKVLYKKIEQVHPRLVNGLKLIKEGVINAGDYKITFHLIKNDLYVIKPIKSFVNNIGNDGSGVHCGASDIYQNDQLNTKKITFVDGLSYKVSLDKIYYSYVHPNNNLIKIAINKVKRIIINIVNFFKKIVRIDV